MLCSRQAVLMKKSQKKPRRTEHFSMLLNRSLITTKYLNQLEMLSILRAFSLCKKGQFMYKNIYISIISVFLLIALISGVM